MSGVRLQVEVIVARPERQRAVPVTLAPGATAEEAVHAAGLAHEVGVAGIGIWGRAVAPQTPVRDGDRVEIYRPLVADPKEARRRRDRRR